MDEFIARGFAATRLDDVAKRAGVAKGTIYLHFKDKEAMFEELVRTAHRADGGASALCRCRPAYRSRDMWRVSPDLLQEVATTRRGDLVRLISPKGRDFPRSRISIIAKWFRAALPACAR